MDDYINTRRRVREAIDDLMTADPTINTVAASGMVVDRDGVEHVRPSDLENGIAAWVTSAWREAELLDTFEEWNDLCNSLYGALQACNSRDAVAEYAAYSFLAMVARERRFMSIEFSQEEPR